MIVFSPSLYFTVRIGPSTPLTVWPTAPLVMVPLGAPGHPGRCPSPLPGMLSWKMRTSTAFWVPSGCGIPPLPMYKPSLMSATVAFTTPTISALSASVRVSGPLADLMYSVLPSTLSMVPLTRWVCCPEAVETANTVAKAAPVRIRIVLMSNLPKG